MATAFGVGDGFRTSNIPIHNAGGQILSQICAHAAQLARLAAHHAAHVAALAHNALHRPAAHHRALAAKLLRHA
eukprot:16452345-Heterocapsa_arctica.AAC.1